MLVRKQILLTDSQEYQLEELAAMAGLSFSKMTRNLLDRAIIKEIKKKAKKKKLTQYEALEKWMAHPVSGPGDSEYDKYAYDL